MALRSSETSPLADLTDDQLVARIPQHGALSSLNVAAAGAVACFQVARRRDGSTAD